MSLLHLSVAIFLFHFLSSSCGEDVRDVSREKRSLIWREGASRLQVHPGLIFVQIVQNNFSGYHRFRCSRWSEKRDCDNRECVQSKLRITDKLIALHQPLRLVPTEKKSGNEMGHLRFIVAGYWNVRPQLKKLHPGIIFCLLLGVDSRENRAFYEPSAKWRARLWRKTTDFSTNWCTWCSRTYRSLFFFNKHVFAGPPPPKRRRSVTPTTNILQRKWSEKKTENAIKFSAIAPPAWWICSRFTTPKLTSNQCGEFQVVCLDRLVS